jgi:lipopolysaccharide biosynthesis glycosyltransferase
VLLIDSHSWSRERISEQAFELLRRHGVTCRFRDQTALNHLLENRWLQLPQHWNTISRELQWSPEAGWAPDPIPAVLHFFDTAKPWTVNLNPQLANRLWLRQAWRLGGLPLLSRLPGFTKRQLLRHRLQEAFSSKHRSLRQAFTQLLVPT